MKDKSGIADQIISLPKGGGAIQGLGEKFQVDLQKGTGNMTIPIKIPENRNKFTPQLALNYSTGNGNGPFGTGWSLSVPDVSRKTSKGIPQYKDNAKIEEEKDIFILSGSEDLVLVSEEKNTGPNNNEIHRYYHPRTEGLFARIKHITGAGKNHWEVTSKSGIKNLYGLTDQNCNSQIFDIHNPHKIFKWMLCRSEDTFGNVIHYHYKRENNEGLISQRFEKNHDHNQVYLSKISYANYNLNVTEKYLFSVSFDYGEYEDNDKKLHKNPQPVKSWDYRPDPFSFYKAGFEIRTVRRCRRILVKVHDIDHDNGQLIKSYRIRYKDEVIDKSKSIQYNNLSSIHSIQLAGHREDNGKFYTEYMPEITFDYTGFNPECKEFETLEANQGLYPERSLSDPNFELIDLFGNGLPDIINTNRTGYRYWKNNGNGQFDIPKVMSKYPAHIALEDRGVQFADMAGNGSADLLVTEGASAGYFETNYDGTWQQYNSYKEAPSLNLEDPNVKMFDMTGDGITDVCMTTPDEIIFFRNLGKEGWDKPRVNKKIHDPDKFPDVSFSAQKNNVRLADMSGDGMQDIVLIHSNRIDYWPNLGYGNFGKCITMHKCPDLPENFDPQKLFLNDIDGDGCADLIYVDLNSVHLWINCQGNFFSEGITITGTPPALPDSLRIADIKGQGTAGILWTFNHGDVSGSTLRFLDLTGGNKPYLLNRIDNNLGALTKIEYCSSTKYYVHDKANNMPWKTHLPFPVLCVAKVTSFDFFSKGKLTAEYFYHHGCWDGREREFIGFGRVDQLDTESFTEFNTSALGSNISFDGLEEKHYSPPTETRTWFHLGALDSESNAPSEIDYTDEYWPGDRQELVRPEIMSDYIRLLPNNEKRDAFRSMRGRELRKEIYGLDGSIFKSRPYNVTEYHHGVKELFRSLFAGTSKPHIFFPHTLAERNTKWERGNDPLTTFFFIDNYDNYGQPQLELNVAVPRGRDYRKRQGNIAKENYLAARTFIRYALPDNPDDVYIFDRVANTVVHQVKDDKQQSVFELWQAVLDSKDDLQPANSLNPEIVSQTINRYDGAAFVGQDIGVVENHGALVRTESLVLTRQILHDAYRSGDTILSPPEEPLYMVPSQINPAWSDEYPQIFQNSTPALSGYVYYNGSPGSGYITGFFTNTERRCYDFQENPPGSCRGLIKTTRDALEQDTNITYDNYDLLSTGIINAAGLTTLAEYHYQVMQPSLVTDANGNRTECYYTPLGLLSKIRVKGKQGQNVGDNSASPSMLMTYDLDAFVRDKLPVSVSIERRIHHINELNNVPVSEHNKTIKSVEYSDGSGRILQTRSQAEDIIFGDSIFGDSGLPAEQFAANGNAIGKKKGVNNPSNVVVSGWQIYNNKGLVVEKYEPCFSKGWEYAFPIAGKNNNKIVIYYNPLGNVLRTVNPDNSEQRIVYGVPGCINSPDISTPDVFEPTSWETYTYDVNDNAMRTHEIESNNYQHHWNTPSSIEIDALGRTIKSVIRNGQNPKTEWYTTRSSYDIKGNLLTVTDQLNRVAFKYTYDLANNQLRIESIDAGIRRVVLDALGNELELRDSKGALFLRTYDLLHRLEYIWSRNNSNAQQTILNEFIEYGDGGDPNQPVTERNANKAKNSLGKVHKHYDEAGLLTFDEYDYKGNVLEKNRKVISNNTINEVFVPAPTNNWEVNAFRMNWQAPANMSIDDYADLKLDSTAYETSTSYDALNRVKSILYPRDAENTRKELKPKYNRAGALEKIEMDNKVFLNHIAYNAKGQRIIAAYGNSKVLTRYTYDPETFRLQRLRSEHYTETQSPQELTIMPAGGTLQDFAYHYDLAGNFSKIIDITPGCGVTNNPDAFNLADTNLSQLLSSGDALIREFSYDPIYRLTRATGRECELISNPRTWSDVSLSGYNAGNHGTPTQTNAPNLTRLYAEKYDYDPTGNMTLLRHKSNGVTWNRNFGIGGMTPHDWQQEYPNHVGVLSEWINAPGNHLTHVGDNDPLNPQTHYYDNSGNLIRETTNRCFEWDHSNKMISFRTQAGNAEPSVYSHYLYDTRGQRVKKLVRKQGGQFESTVYIDEIFEHHRWTKNGIQKQNNCLHIMDEQQRIALIKIGDKHNDDNGPDIQYHLGDHLGSNNIVIDDSGNWINREEYFPFGETSLGSFSKKRYRHSGKERDEESGLYYYGARYYAAWIDKWCSCDPIGPFDKLNLYCFVENNPIKLRDAEGMQGDPGINNQDPNPDMVNDGVNHLNGDPGPDDRAGGDPDPYIEKDKEREIENKSLPSPSIISPAGSLTELCKWVDADGVVESINFSLNIPMPDLIPTVSFQAGIEIITTPEGEWEGYIYSPLIGFDKTFNKAPGKSNSSPPKTKGISLSVNHGFGCVWGLKDENEIIDLSRYTGEFRGIYLIAGAGIGGGIDIAMSPKDWDNFKKNKKLEEARSIQGVFGMVEGLSFGGGITKYISFSQIRTHFQGE